MYNILVVDDEPISADGITEYLRENGSDDWNIKCAYTPHQALELAEDRVDILLTDITMPNLSGYTLYERIHERWPRSQVIYLTGNLSVEYVQKAIRSSFVVDYILKTEKESVVCKAVQKASEQLDNALKKMDFETELRNNLRKALPTLRKEYMLRLLWNEEPEWNRINKLEQYESPLDPCGHLLLVCGKIDYSLQSHSEDGLELITMDMIMKSTLHSMFIWDSVRVDRERFVYCIQSHKSSQAKCKGGKLGMELLPYMELVQQGLCQRGMSLSIIIDEDACDWAELPNRYATLFEALERNTLIPEALWVYSTQQGIHTERSRVDYEVESKLRKVLSAKDLQAAEATVSNLLYPYPASPDEQLAIYTALVAALKPQLLAADWLHDGLYIPSLRTERGEHGWNHMAEVFLSLVRKLMGSIEQNLYVDTIIQRVNRYIEDAIDKDLSLTTVASMINLSPTYFSKLYKHITGEGFARYVMKRRMERAGILLRNGNQKISDVALCVGYDSTSYFIRTFRKEYDVTPAEYRRTY